MIEPTPSDIAAAKQVAAKKFGHDRLVGVTFVDPVTGASLVEVLIAVLRWPDAVAYHDARTHSILQARAALLSERLVWPSADVLMPLRDAWAAFDRRVEDEFRITMGFSPGDTLARARALTAASPPPGLDPKRAAALLEENEGSRLWSVYQRANGLACVLRSPTTDVWQMTQVALGEAHANRVGQLCPILDIISDHCVWCPSPTLRAHVEESPGRAEDLIAPWNELGGAAAKTSSRFL